MHGVVLPCFASASPNDNPLSNKYGTYHTVNSRFWPWLSAKSISTLSMRSLFARKHNPPSLGSGTTPLATDRGVGDSA